MRHTHQPAKEIDMKNHQTQQPTGPSSILWATRLLLCWRMGSYPELLHVLHGGLRGTGGRRLSCGDDVKREEDRRIWCRVASRFGERAACASEFPKSREKEDSADESARDCCGKPLLPGYSLCKHVWKCDLTPPDMT